MSAGNFQQLFSWSRPAVTSSMSSLCFWSRIKVGADWSGPQGLVLWGYVAAASFLAEEVGEAGGEQGSQVARFQQVPSSLFSTLRTQSQER